MKGPDNKEDKSIQKDKNDIDALGASIFNKYHLGDDHIYFYTYFIDVFPFQTDHEILSLLSYSNFKKHITNAKFYTNILIKKLLERETSVALQYVLLDDKDYSSLEWSIKELINFRHHYETVEKYMLNTIQSKDDLYVAAHDCYKIATEPTAIKFFLEEFPKLSYLCNDKNSGLMKVLPGLLSMLPIVLVNIIKEYSCYYQSMEILYENPIRLFQNKKTIQLEFKEEQKKRYPFRFDVGVSGSIHHVSEYLREPLAMYHLYASYDHDEFNDYICGLTRLHDKEKIVFQSGTKAPHNSFWRGDQNLYHQFAIRQDADIGTLTGSQGVGMHVILKTARGKKEGVQLAFQLGWFIGKQRDWVYQALADELKPIEFAEAVLMIAFYRYFRDLPSKQQRIIQLLPMISEYVDGIARSKPALNVENFQASNTFNVLANTTVVAEVDFAARSKALRQYAKPSWCSFFENQKPVAQELLNTLDGLEIKTEALIRHHVKKLTDNPEMNEFKFSQSLKKLSP